MQKMLGNCRFRRKQKLSCIKILIGSPPDLDNIRGNRISDLEQNQKANAPTAKQPRGLKTHSAGLPRNTFPGA